MLINPALNPIMTLKEYEDKEVICYSKSSSFIFKKEYLLQLNQYVTSQFNNKNILLLLQIGDTTVDYKESINFIPEVKMIIESGGSHQFDGIEKYFEHIGSFMEINRPRSKL